MANILDPMDLKQIITMHLDGASNRKIGSTLHISRNTVNTYMQLFAASDYTLQELLELNSAELSELFTYRTTVDIERHNELMIYFEGITRAQSHPGFTFLNHYQEYYDQAKNPYSYTQFLEHYRRKYPKEKGSMKFNHIAGEEMLIDFAGNKLHIVNRDTGEVTAVEVFVAILPSSQYTFVRACMSQKKEDLCACCTEALSFYGGVPKAIVSDNLRAAVDKSSKYEPVINRSFKDMARHYNTVVNPTKAYSPQEKGLVEGAVKLVYQRIYYPMRNMVFFSLEDLNKEIGNHLKRYNELMFQEKGASRIELFQSIERQLLKPLPMSLYEFKDYKRAKVQKIGYVYFSPDKCYYSVSYRFIGKETQIHFTRSRIEVHYNHQRIALHQRNYKLGTYVTEKDHLSSTHKFYSDWSLDYFKKMALPHGEYVVQCIENTICAQDYPEVGYKRALGIIQLHRGYGSERLNNACKRAIETDSCSYLLIKNILKNNMDKVPPPTPQQEKSHIPVHNNIRGASAYN